MAGFRMEGHIFYSSRAVSIIVLQVHKANLYICILQYFCDFLKFIIFLATYITCSLKTILLPLKFCTSEVVLIMTCSTFYCVNALIEYFNKINLDCFIRV